MEGLGRAASKPVWLRFMPMNPRWLCAVVDIEICNRFEALLDLNAPGEWVFITLSVEQYELLGAGSGCLSDGRESAVTFMANVHEPCVHAVAEHAHAWPFCDRYPQLKLWNLAEAIQRLTQSLDRHDIFRATVERDGYTHACLNLMYTANSAVYEWRSGITWASKFLEFLLKS
jgi:hypothetical protein